MRTLQEKYNGIQEGKFSKDQFIVEARMQHPNLITRFNGYADAVSILKNRGMIQEAEESFADIWKHTLETDNLDKLKSFLKVKGKEGLAQVKSKLSSLHGKAKEKVAKAAGIELDENLNEARLTKNSLTDYRFKPTNDMDKYPYEQILRGLRVELEVLGVHGTPTPEEYTKALTKVSKNLAKDAIFYTNQLAGVNPKVDLHDKMVDATAKNTVDTFNGMKKATLKEGLKNLIKQALQEEEEVYELQGPKEDSYYKSELSEYLDDNGIFGFTNRIHSIMTGPDQDENAEDLAKYLEDNQIYGYNKGIERIYADYPYDQHWMNQPDQEDLDEATSEADMALIRKFITMAETEPSKFETLYKQAEVQASTSKDVRFKHLLSLMDRANAFYHQSMANQDKFEADREGMYENELLESVSLTDLLK
jgi:hypothetical protein